ncbi:hypothetical protein [Lentzea sp. CA-135723]|uniref:hypothetical protein n=1 Tax=Lentzea sp. CA-135723 TaxID=3239950 RepID=UPI003D8F2BAB
MIEEIPTGNSGPTLRLGSSGPDDAEQPPGNPSRLRALAETVVAQRAPLADAADRVQGVGTTHWSSVARDGYVLRRDDLAKQWRAARDIHAAVSARVNQHNGFLHELPHLWEVYRTSPENRLHVKELHDGKAAELAAFLLEQAAKLDDLAPAEAATEEPIARFTPKPRPKPVAVTAVEPEAREEPRPGDSDQEEPDAVQEDVPLDEAAPDPVAQFEQRLRERELLTEALQNGRRVERIPYHGLIA